MYSILFLKFNPTKIKSNSNIYICVHSSRQLNNLINRGFFRTTGKPEGTPSPIYSFFTQWTMHRYVVIHKTWTVRQTFFQDKKKCYIYWTKKKRHFCRLHLFLFINIYTLSALAAGAEEAVAGEPEDFFT